jgi:hypothetical protein
MPLPLYKNIEVREQSFRLNRMTATDADWIKNLLLMGMMKDQRAQETDAAPNAELEKLTPEQKADGLISVLWLKGGMALDEDRYRSIQTRCLFTCSRVNGDALSPVMMVDGRWTDADLKTDAQRVSDIILEVLKFNLQPFFLDGASSAPNAPATQASK